MHAFDDDSIIHPFKTAKDREVPKDGVLFVNPAEARAAHDMVLNSGGQRFFLHNSKLSCSANGEWFVAGPSVGAPVAALVLEKLIVLGARRVIQMGWCGGIAAEMKIGDVFIPNGAVSGEGTSRYYHGDQFPSPSNQLTADLIHEFGKRNLSPRTGRHWSTDAPYRESRKLLMELQQKYNVKAVDMEYSALCSVAIYRKINFSAVMVVSDELMGKKWRPGFKDPTFRHTCSRVVDILLKRE